MGLFLLILAALGFFGVLGPTADESALHNLWWLDDEQNLIHLAAGLACFGFARWMPDEAKEGLCWIFGLAGVMVAIASLFLDRLTHANVERPIETVLYFTLGDLFLWTATRQVQKQKDLLLREIERLSNNNAKLT